jgi:acylphosphatase
MPLARKRVRIAGRVQGVGFRYAACDAARRLNLTGFVRNCQDGTVEAVVEGAPGDVDAFVSWCAHGPRGADVTRVEASDERPRGERDFRIER